LPVEAVEALRASKPSRRPSSSCPDASSPTRGSSSSRPDANVRLLLRTPRCLDLRGRQGSSRGVDHDVGEDRGNGKRPTRSQKAVALAVPVGRCRRRGHGARQHCRWPGSRRPIWP
jgi:hypothetical protein